MKSKGIKPNNICTLTLSAVLLMLSACSSNAGSPNQISAQSQPEGMGGDMGDGGMGYGMGDGMGAGMGQPYVPPVISTEPITLKSEIDRCALIKSSIEEAGFSDKVKVNCAGNAAQIVANTVPDHPVLTGIIATNEQTVAPAEGFTQLVPLSPVLTGKAQTRDASLAVAVNGVPIYDYTGGGEMTEEALAHHQERHDTLLTNQLDICGGHAGRADDYHYHVTPTCMIDIMDNKDEDDAIIGWAFDGFPIFRDNNPDGTTIMPGELDVCNGKADSTFGYRYHTSQEAPYIIQCIMGEVASIEQLAKIIPPHAKGQPNTEKNPGFPPRGGVQNLTLTTLDDGVRSLDYEYQGKPYYIRYTLSETPGCFHYTQRTVTDNGRLVEGEFCR